MAVVSKMKDADTGNDCLWFWCPGCEGYHMVPVSVGTRRHPGTTHKDKTWLWNGSVDKPTLTPSVNHPGVCHFFITDGVVKYCGDSKHGYAGKDYALPKFTAW